MFSRFMYFFIFIFVVFTRRQPCALVPCLRDQPVKTNGVSRRTATGVSFAHALQILMCEGCALYAIAWTVDDRADSNERLPCLPSFFFLSVAVINMFLNGYHDGAVEVSHSTPFANVGTIFDVTEGQCHKEDMSVRYKHECFSCLFLFLSNIP